MSDSFRSSILDGGPLFPEAKPTCNLYRPDIETFLTYSRALYRDERSGGDNLCRALELRLAEFHEAERAITVTSGFWAHVMAMSALALPGRREIVAPAFGYRRTDDMIAWAGYVPHFCDIDAETLALSVETVRAALNDNTALILAPHPMVNCCDAQEIEELGRAHSIPVVFDSVEASYRVYNNRRIGGFGQAEAFSMHAPKLLNSFEGGYITTNNTQLADQLEKMKRFDVIRSGSGQTGKGLDATLSEIHAAMALASLNDVDTQVPQHRRKYDRYVAGLGKIDGLKIVEHKTSHRPDYRLIVVRIGDAWPLSREGTLRVLEAQNILARPYYFPLTQKVVEYSRICPKLPVTEAICRSLMVLPSGMHVSEDDVEKIVDVLANILSYY